MPIPNRKLSMMNYGASGVGKTSQFRYFSRYVWDKYKLRSRFICTDGGSLWECVQDYIEEGFVDALLVPSDPAYNPFSVMRKLGKGMWPAQGDRGVFRINLPVEAKVNGKSRVENEYAWMPWSPAGKRNDWPRLEPTLLLVIALPVLCMTQP